MAAKNECFELSPSARGRGSPPTPNPAPRSARSSSADEDCDLRAEIQVSPSFDAKLVVYGDPDATPLPKDFLVKPDNRLIVKSDDDGTTIDEQLCGVCTEIRDDKVTIVLPLAASALLRSSKSVEITIKLGEKELCSFTLNCEDLRKALDWATDRQTQLASDYDAKTLHADGAGMLHHLRLLRSARPRRRLLRARHTSPLSRQVLIKRPDGAAAIALYYRVAPVILAEMPESKSAAARLRALYVALYLAERRCRRLGFARLCLPALRAE